MNADVRALARWSSLARLAEPALVRSLRLQLQPSAHAGVEADLWWSGLVESRTTRGIVLTDAAARELRDELRQLHQQGDPRPGIAWSLVQQHHRQVSPAVALEEEIAWLAVSLKDPGPTIEQRLQTVLAAILNDGRTNLGYWGGRALPYLPTIARQQPAAWYLEQLARTMQPRLKPLGTWAPSTVDPVLLARVTDPNQTTALGVLRWGDRLYLGDVGPDGFSIQVPRSDPRAVEVVRSYSSPGEEVILVPQGERRQIAVGWSESVSLRTAHGDVHHIAAPDEDQRRLRDVTVTFFDERGQQCLGVIVGRRLLATTYPDPEGLVVELPRLRGSRLSARTVRRRGGVTLMEVERSLPSSQIPLRRRRRAPEADRCWSGIVLLPGASTPISGLVRDPSFADIPGSPVLLQARSSATELGLVNGGPMVVSGELAGLITHIVPGADFGGDGDLAYGAWAGLWEVMYPDAADAPLGQWLNALAELLQSLCLEAHNGRQSGRRSTGSDTPYLERVRVDAKFLLQETVNEFAAAVVDLVDAPSLARSADIPDLNLSYLVSYLEAYDPRQPESLSLLELGGSGPLRGLVQKHPALGPIVWPSWRIHRGLLAALEPSVFSSEQDLRQFLDAFLEAVGRLLRTTVHGSSREVYVFSVTPEAASILPLEPMFGVSPDHESADLGSASDQIEESWIELNPSTLLEVFEWARGELLDALDLYAESGVAAEAKGTAAGAGDSTESEPILFNRAALRSYLRELADPATRPRVLVVTGPPGSGKTYTTTFVRQFARDRDFDVRYQQATPATTVGSLVQDLVDSSSSARRAAPPQSDAYGTTQRYHRALAIWLVREQDSDRPTWWILDGLPADGASGAQLTDFIVKLAAQLAETPNQLRLVLLGFDPDPLRRSSIDFLHDVLEPPSADDAWEGRGP